MKQGDTVWGTYSPQRTDDLTNSRLHLVGGMFQFTAGEMITEGRFAGQRAMISEFGASPECDVRIERRD